jgi:ABC-type glutathione transport system ATPase component
MPADLTRSIGPLVIDIENITKDYVMGEETVHALRGVSLQIHRTNTSPLWARAAAESRPS